MAKMTPEDKIRAVVNKIIEIKEISRKDSVIILRDRDIYLAPEDTLRILEKFASENLIIPGKRGIDINEADFTSFTLTPQFDEYAKSINSHLRPLTLEEQRALLGSKQIGNTTNTEKMDNANLTNTNKSITKRFLDNSFLKHPIIAGIIVGIILLIVGIIIGTNKIQKKNSENPLSLTPVKSSNTQITQSTMTKKIKVESEIIKKQEKVSFKVFLNGHRSTEKYIYVGGFRENARVSLDIGCNAKIIKSEIFVEIRFSNQLNVNFRDSDNKDIEYTLDERGNKMFQLRIPDLSIPKDMKIQVGSINVDNINNESTGGLVTIYGIDFDKQEIPFTVFFR